MRAAQVIRGGLAVGMLVLGLAPAPAGAEAPGSISGIVTSWSGGPLEGVEICPFNETAPGGFGCGNTGADGRYTVGDLSPGNYSLYFDGQYVNHGFEYYEDTTDYDSRALVTVADGADTAGINAELGPRLDPGSISGTVTKWPGLPLEGARVCAMRRNGSGHGCANTGADGSYSVGNLLPADYSLSFEGMGANYALEFYDDTTDYDARAFVTVTEGADTAGINAELALLPDPGSVSGIVTSTAGGPLDGVHVCATSETPGGGFGCAYSGAEGSYVITDLPAADYSLYFEDSAANHESEYYDDTVDYSERALVTVIEGADTSGIDAELAALPGSVSGTVTGPDDAPLEDVWVLAYRDSDGFAPTAIVLTGADGTYTFDALPAGSYRIGFLPVGQAGMTGGWFDGVPSRSLATRLTVGPSPVTGVNAKLKVAASMSGIVRDPGGEGVAGVKVTLYTPADGYFSFLRTTTAADGSFAFPSLQPGSYKVFLRPPSGSGLATEWFDDATGRNDATNLDLADGASMTIDAALAEAGALLGV